MNAGTQPTETLLPLTPSEIDAEQARKWQDTEFMMGWTAPGFRHLFYTLLNAQNDGSKYTAIMSTDGSVPYAATDGRNIIVNPDTFFKFTLPQRVYVLGHEIVHNVYGDIELLNLCKQNDAVPQMDGSTLPFDEAIMQKVMDWRINALLDESNIGSRPDVGHFNDKVTSRDGVLDLYGKEYKAKPPGKKKAPGQGNPGGPGNPGGFDKLMKPGAATGKTLQQAARDPQKWAVAVATAQHVEKSHHHGNLPLGLQRLFASILEPEVNWLDHIETLINRTVGDGGYDWTMPDPWWSALDIFSPASTGLGAGHIVVWGDTSGSRSDQEIASNIGELAGVLEDVRPSRLTVAWCDAAIGRIDEVEDISDLEHIQAKGVPGHGGTDLQPVLDWINALDEPPDLLICFTDGYLTFPKKDLRYPVIWASSTDVEYPFGQVVRVNKGPH